ncbi:hypothetical protein, partial [Stieleria mannarensis]|uniref:hypothetical protein n=1 Tax=Stieleria mannarensis TaxID=2755585 RepID=UPI001C71A1D5
EYEYRDAEYEYEYEYDPRQTDAGDDDRKVIAESNGPAGGTMCLRPGGPAECQPVVSATRDGFLAMLKVQRADTITRASIAPVTAKRMIVPALQALVVDYTGSRWLTPPASTVPALRASSCLSIEERGDREVKSPAAHPIEYIGHPRRWLKLSSCPTA